MGAAELLRARGGLVAPRRGVGCGRRAGGGLGVRRRGREEERAEAQRGNRAGVWEGYMRGEQDLVLLLLKLAVLLTRWPVGLSLWLCVAQRRLLRGQG